MKECKAIFIVAGHSSSNPWAEYNWLKERDIVMSITEMLSEKLESHTDIDIFEMTEDLSLKEKATFINKVCTENWYNLDNSILLEIHTNSTEKPNTWTWIETLIYNNFKPWIELATDINAKLAFHTWLQNRGYKNGKQFYIINSTVPLAWIVECWFINTDNDRRILSSNKTSIVYWIYDWLKKYIWFKEVNIFKPDWTKEKVEAFNKMEVNVYNPELLKEKINELTKQNEELEITVRYLQGRMDKIKLFANMENR
jgi:N-acetylmuramoyl-L-alanine amidase